MIYRLPEISDEQLLQAYRQEHYDNGESGISASMGLAGSPYADWVEKIHRNASTGDSEWGRSLLYLCFDEEGLVGLLSIRWELSDELTEKYGHIGYGVRPTRRNRGYATAMLRHALTVCKEKGLNQVLLGCYADNLPSQAVIRKNGGVLISENDNYAEGRMSRYYEIRL
jgi:predicted acetyltransferase